MKVSSIACMYMYSNTTFIFSTFGYLVGGMSNLFPYDSSDSRSDVQSEMTDDSFSVKQADVITSLG